MINKTQLAVIGASVVGFLAPVLAFADNDFVSPGDAEAIVVGAVTNIGTVLNNALPTILLVASALLGVAVLWRWLRRTVK